MTPEKLPARIGLLGDVHGDYEALVTALAFIKNEGISVILCTGDIIDGHDGADECCSLLKSAGIPTVRGNHDRWFSCQGLRDLPDSTPFDAVSSENKQWLAGLPKTLSFESGAGNVLLCHGLRENDMTCLRPGDYGYGLEVNEDFQALVREIRYRLVFCGHSHEVMVRSFGPVTFVNPGALWSPHGGCFAIVDFERREVLQYCVPVDGQVGLRGRVCWG